MMNFFLIMVRYWFPPSLKLSSTRSRCSATPRLAIIFTCASQTGRCRPPKGESHQEPFLSVLALSGKKGRVRHQASLLTGGGRRKDVWSCRANALKDTFLFRSWFFLPPPK